MTAAVDEGQLTAQLMKINRGEAFIAEHVPGDAALDTVFDAPKDACRDEVLRLRIRIARGLVAVELAVNGLIAELITHLRVRQFETGVDRFVETKVAAV